MSSARSKLKARSKDNQAALEAARRGMPAPAVRGSAELEAAEPVEVVEPEAVEVVEPEPEPAGLRLVTEEAAGAGRDEQATVEPPIAEDTIEVDTIEVDAIETAEVVEAVEANEPAAEVVQEPASTPRRTTRAKKDESAVDRWRDLIKAPALYGSATATVRHNTAIPISVHNRMLEVDAAIASEGSRWVISRNALLAMAIQRVIDDPERYASGAPSDEPTVALQGRIPTEVAEALNRTRYTGTGRRPIKHMVGAAVSEILGD